MEDTQWTRKKPHKRKQPKKENELQKMVGFFDDLFHNKKEGFSAPAPAPAPAPAVSLDSETASLQENIDTKLDNAEKGKDGEVKTVETEINSLRADISNILSDVEQLNSIGSEKDSISGNLNTPSPGTSQSLKYLNSKTVTSGANTSVSEIASLIQRTVQKLISYLILAKKSVELFILELNSNITTVITKMSNALTQNTATDAEIQTFQDQTHKFLSIMTVWLFVYNWYYVFFYLEPQDGIRHTFDPRPLQDYSEILYGAFGPSAKVVEKLNDGIIWMSDYVKRPHVPFTTIKGTTPNALIYIILFGLFAILVSTDFQSTLIIDFFNSLRHKSGMSVLYIMNVIMVGIFAAKYFFWDSDSLNLLFLPYFMGIPLYFIVLYMYVIWTSQISVPLGMIFICGYLVMNCFFSVFYYEGFNAMNIFTGISNNIAPIGPDLNAGDVCIDYESPSWYMYLRSYPPVIWHYSKIIINYMTAYMFEFIVILLLLGGIGTYSATLQNAIQGKIGMGAFNPSSIKQAFKQLFTWLILINIIIIVLIVMFAVKKYRQIQSLTPSVSKGTKKVDMSVFYNGGGGMGEPGMGEVGRMGGTGVEPEMRGTRMEEPSKILAAGGGGSLYTKMFNNNIGEV